MRILTPFLLVLPVAIAGEFVERDVQAKDKTFVSPASLSTSNAPIATESDGLGGLEPSQAPDSAPGDVPAPANPMVSAISLTISITSTSPPSSSTSTTTSTINTNIGQPLDYTTTKWYESWVGGTYSTWFPTVITVIHKTPAPPPPPGKGEIGMGSITGKTGQTQTVDMGAAPTHAAAWAKGVAAAIGVGIAGMVV